MLSYRRVHMIFPVPSQFRVVQGFAAIATFDDTLSEDPVKYSQQYPNIPIMP